MNIKQLREIGVNNAAAEKIAAEFDVLRADIKIANGTISEMQSLLDDYADEHPKLIDEVKSLRAQLEARGSAEPAPAAAVPDHITGLINNVEHWGLEHTGNEPSLSCFHQAIHQLREALSAAHTPPSAEQVNNHE